MLREGLAAEFPFVKRMLLSIRRPRVAREDPRWAAVSGFGASWLIGSCGQALATLIRVAGFRDPASWTAGAFTLIGGALGLAVALRAGGRRGLLSYGAGLLAIAGFTLTMQLPAYIEMCSRQLGFECSPIQLVLPHLYTAGGVLLGAAAVGLIASGKIGTNPVLSAGGAFALAQQVAFTLWRLTSLYPTDPIGGLWLGIGFVVVGMVAAGVAIWLRATRGRSIIVFALVITGIWLFQQGPFIWEIARGAYAVTSPVDLYPVVVGPVQLVALAIGWAAARLARPDDGSGLMEMRGGVEPDEQDPAAGRELP